jgi:hypothetical protein
MHISSGSTPQVSTPRAPIATQLSCQCWMTVYPPLAILPPPPISVLESYPGDPAPAAAIGVYDFDIDVLDVYSLLTCAHISRSSDSISTVVDLISHGFLGTTPILPSLAISLKTLELFRRIRLRKASFSVEAFVKVICDLYNVSSVSLCIVVLHQLPSLDKMPYRRRYRVALAGAFNIYLAILRGIDKRVLSVLGHDTPNWRVLNACPPCGYQVSYCSLMGSKC